MTKYPTLANNLKDQIIKQVFHNETITLAEKIEFCQDLENFGQTWRSLIFAPELAAQEKPKQNDLVLEKMREKLNK